MAEHPAAENKMGVMPVNTLLLNMAIPIMISMLVQAFYNVLLERCAWNEKSKGYLAALNQGCRILSNFSHCIRHGPK